MSDTVFYTWDLTMNKMGKKLPCGAYILTAPSWDPKPEKSIQVPPQILTHRDCDIVNIYCDFKPLSFAQFVASQQTITPGGQSVQNRVSCGGCWSRGQSGRAR